MSESTSSSFSADLPLPTSPDELLARFEALGIDAPTQRHDAVFTVEESVAVRDSLPVGSPGGAPSPDAPGGHCKNLFLKTKKNEMFLACMLEHRKVDLKALGTKLAEMGFVGARLSFARPERLWETLGVRPGSVTPFAVINDTDRAVTVLLDADFQSFRWLHFHPLINDQTTMISPADLVAFLEAEGHAPRFIDFG